ncbi:hypothetical protein ACKU2E_026905 [Klebsiella pneumoniae]
MGEIRISIWLPDQNRKKKREEGEEKGRREEEGKGKGREERRERGEGNRLSTGTEREKTEKQRENAMYVSR